MGDVTPLEPRLRDGPFRSEHSETLCWGVRFKGKDVTMRFGTAHEALMTYEVLVENAKNPPRRPKPVPTVRPPSWTR